jgi:hypothetical protein
VTGRAGDERHARLTRVRLQVDRKKWGRPMSDDAYEQKPVITLLDGQVVLRAIFDLVRTLRASGYTITIVGNGDEVQVSPRIHENAWAILDSNWQDVSAVLDAEDQKTSRVRARGQKVERVH